MSEGTTPLQIVEMGPLVEVETWAMYEGARIADKCMPDGSFLERSVLTNEIAVALTGLRQRYQGWLDELQEQIDSSKKQ